MLARTCVVVAGLVAGCGGGGGPAPVTAAPAAAAAPDDLLTVGTPTCTAAYSPETSTPAPAAWVAAAAAVITATMNDDASRIDAQAAATFTMREGGPADPTAERLASLRAALRTIPADCPLVWFDEPRLDVQPAFDDASPAEEARIAAAQHVIADAMQLVGTCGGCPVIALALTGAPDRARAVGWSPLAE